MKKLLFLCVLSISSLYATAQQDNDSVELGPLNGENENEARARDQLFGSWDWVSRTRGGSTSRPQDSQGGEQCRVSFDRSGKVTVAVNGKVVNGTTYALMEDDARLIFTRWDAPNEFKIDEGPFDFDNNILWIRGEYNDQGATWQFVKAGTQAYTPAYVPAPPAQTIVQPAAAPVRARQTATKRKGRR